MFGAAVYAKSGDLDRWNLNIPWGNTVVVGNPLHVMRIRLQTKKKLFVVANDCMLGSRTMA